MQKKSPLEKMNEDYARFRTYALARIREKLAQKIDINHRNKQGQTLLHQAVFWDDETLATELLRHRAHPHLQDSLGCTPLNCALALGKEKCADMLLNAILAHKLNPHTADNDKYTPLHYAVLKQNYPMAQKLIELKADVNARDHTGDTPLNIAATHVPSEKSKEIIALLLEHHALATLKNHVGYSAADIINLTSYVSKHTAKS